MISERKWQEGNYFLTASVPGIVIIAWPFAFDGGEITIECLENFPYDGAMSTCYFIRTPAVSNEMTLTFRTRPRTFNSKRLLFWGFLNK